MPAPIALIVYRRPQHLARVLTALAANAEAKHSVLYVFSDAAKDHSSVDDVLQVRNIVQGISGFANVQSIFRESNFGLSRNTLGGVSAVLAEHETVIMVEDDTLVAPNFLKFANEALDYYRDNPRISCVTGYCYNTAYKLPDTFFLRGGESWGIATWRDRWAVYNPDGKELLAQLRAKRLLRAFDFNGAVRRSEMLRDQIAGRNDSWAIRWHASCFLRDMLSLYPGMSLIQNIGFDGYKTTHGDKTDMYDVDLNLSSVPVGGIAVEEGKLAKAAIREFFLRSQPRIGLARRIWRRFKKFVRN
jgi:hypothetical protein